MTSEVSWDQTSQRRKKKKKKAEGERRSGGIRNILHQYILSRSQFIAQLTQEVCFDWTIPPRPYLPVFFFFFLFLPSVFLHPFNIHRDVSKTAILLLTVLMHYDGIPTTDCRPSKTPFMPHFVGWMECNQTFSTLWLPRTGTVISGWGIGWLMAVSQQPSIGTLQTGKVVVARYWNGQCR